MTAYLLQIRMGDDEWSSTTDMDQLAREQLELHPDKRPMVVLVQEHAGWYLAYAMVGNRLVVVDTANDAAAVTPERRQFWESVRGAKWKMLPGVDRNKVRRP